MLLLAIITVELVLLFFLTATINKTLYLTFYVIFRNKHAASGLITFLFLPGTAVHELAHLITAEILRVRTGELSFTPHIEKNDTGREEIKAGSLKIAQTDPLRRFLIGFAPVVWGMAGILVIILTFQHLWPQALDTSSKFAVACLTGYLLFAVSNSMFSSRADMQGAQYFLPVIALVTLALYLTGVRLSLTGKALEWAVRVVTALAKALGAVTLFNILILIGSGLFLRFLTKLFHLEIRSST